MFLRIWVAKLKRKADVVVGCIPAKKRNPLGKVRTMKRTVLPSSIVVIPDTPLSPLPEFVDTFLCFAA